ncbi:hypothetical protein [Halalkaliarchaeum desulfuricum]|uniref:hypothetical protein n=1 Tax=Halalkaliarchaeum desulfuricum TaxID=2055893 RepID=UPI0012B52FD4|nr:hypothetical protein [Halalkaliarchaeum desulfuricum]
MATRAHPLGETFEPPIVSLLVDEDPLLPDVGTMPLSDDPGDGVAIDGDSIDRFRTDH